MAFSPSRYAECSDGPLEVCNVSVCMQISPQEGAEVNEFDHGQNVLLTCWSLLLSMWYQSVLFLQDCNRVSIIRAAKTWMVAICAISKRGA
jgi:hypothetical protein